LFFLKFALICLYLFTEEEYCPSENETDAESDVFPSDDDGGDDEAEEEEEEEEADDGGDDEEETSPPPKKLAKRENLEKKLEKKRSKDVATKKASSSTIKVVEKKKKNNKSTKEKQEKLVKGKEEKKTDKKKTKLPDLEVVTSDKVRVKDVSRPATSYQEENFYLGDRYHLQVAKVNIRSKNFSFDSLVFSRQPPKDNPENKKAFTFNMPVKLIIPLRDAVNSIAERNFKSERNMEKNIQMDLSS
jgi:hypothetical protein